MLSVAGKVSDTHSIFEKNQSHENSDNDKTSKATQ